MKKLITTAALALALTIPAVTFGATDQFGVQIPVEENGEIYNNLDNTRAEEDYMSFYTNTDKTDNELSSEKSVVKKIDLDDGYTVFGAEVPATPES